MTRRPYDQDRRERGRALFDDLRRRGILNVKATDEQLDFFGDAAIYADIQAEQDLAWIRSALRYAERVGNGSAIPSEISLFWIRAGGVLLDVGAHYRTSLANAAKVFGGLPSDVHSIQLTRTLVDAITALAQALPEDELHYLEYRRHVECHPRQSAYRARLNKDGSLKRVKSNVSGTARLQHESEDALRGVLTRYGVDETRIAIEIARRLVEPLRKVEIAARPLCEPMP